MSFAHLLWGMAPPAKCFLALIKLDKMIEINNLTAISVDEEFLKKIVQGVLKGESANWQKENKDLSAQASAKRAKKDEVSLSIALVGQGRIRKINKTYRGKNRATDVLAFPESKVLLEKFKVGPIQRTQNLGEIIICLREVNKNARKDNVTLEKELAKVLIHGILHLLGEDHEITEEKAKTMEKKEQYYLSKVGEHQGYAKN